MTDRLIITAASRSYAPSLLALLGSLNLNWPNHPPVRVYDLGMDNDTLQVLAEHNIEVVKVPQFCPHWRKHFTWKIWCLNDAPADQLLWLDAGLVVLKPLDEIFVALRNQGYFLVPNYQLLEWEASEAACQGCGVPPEFRTGKLTLTAALMGFRKSGIIQTILKEALSIALEEEHIAATKVTHRHEQAIISLLIYKYMDMVILADGLIYLGWLSPNQVNGQKVWVHRRSLLSEDLRMFQDHITTPGAPYNPRDPALHQTKLPFWKRALFFIGNASNSFKRSIGEKEEPQVYDGDRD